MKTITTKELDFLKYSFVFCLGIGGDVLLFCCVCMCALFFFCFNLASCICNWTRDPRSQKEAAVEVSKNQIVENTCIYVRWSNYKPAMVKTAIDEA